MSTVLESLRLQLPTLTRRGTRVAEYILGDPSSVLHCSVGEIATRVGVSQPTVIRLCRTVGCDGYADFKLKLAQCLAPGIPFVSALVYPDDDAPTYTAKVFDAAIAALHDARAGLHPQDIEWAAHKLAYARRIILFGLGGSAATTLDAAHKLGRFSAPCQACSDPVTARMWLASCGADDVLLVISNTGRTRAVVELVEQARTSPLTVIAITAPASPLARVAQRVLGIEPAEDAELYTPMASRIAHLALVDVLATGVALALGPAITPHLAELKMTLRATRLPPEDKQ